MTDETDAARSTGGRPSDGADGPGGHDGPNPTENGASEPIVRWGLGTAIGALVGFLAVSSLFGVLFVEAGMDSVAGSVLATIAGWVALAGWPVLASLRRGAGPVADLALRFRPVDLAYGLGGFLVLGVAASVFVMIYLQIAGEMPESALGAVAEESTHRWQLLLLALMALGASVMEEVHFRGMWWNVLRRKGLGAWGTLLVTSAIFAVIHIEPQRVVLLFVAGCVIGFVRMRTGRLGPAIVTHLLVNGLGAITLLVEAF